MGYRLWRFNISELLLCLFAGSWGYLFVKDETGQTGGWLSLTVSAVAAVVVDLLVQFIKSRARSR